MKIFFVSLGCDKNLVDSEVMIALLSEAGYELTDEETEADIAVVNTCCFINDAKEESINTLLEMADLKQNGKCRLLIAAGCLAQRYKDEILTEIPEVDAIVGTASAERLPQVIEQALGGKKQAAFDELDRPVSGKKPRMLTTGGHYAYLKIAEGCSKHCTYCVIPGVRGPYRSVPMEDLISEAAALVEGGARELILVAQETTLYGTDLYKKKCLPQLLRALVRIPELSWIRILYCYPEEITDELIQTIRSEEKIVHYLDIPIQHASDRILKRMGRRTDRAEITERIARLREQIPDIALRTTFITGFPGETPEDVDELLDFTDEIGFERLGVFTYSMEEGTPAALMPDQIPEQEKQDRRAAVMELQQQISYEHGQSMIGKVLDVFVEGWLPDEGVYVGRTYMDAPGVDGYIFFDSYRDLESGMFVKVKVTGASEYDLTGVIIYEDESS